MSLPSGQALRPENQLVRFDCRLPPLGSAEGLLALAQELGRFARTTALDENATDSATPTPTRFAPA